MNTNKIDYHNSVHNLYITDHEFVELASALTKQFNTQVAIYLLPLSPTKIICVRSHGYVTDFPRVTTVITEQARAAAGANENAGCPKLYMTPVAKADPQELLKKDVADLNQKMRDQLRDLAKKHGLVGSSLRVEGNSYEASVYVRY